MFVSHSYHLASASGDNTVKIWDMRTLRNIYTIPAHRSLVADVKYNKGPANEEGFYLTTAGYDGSVKIWSGDDYRLIKSLEGHENKVMGVDTSNGKRMGHWGLWSFTSKMSMVLTGFI